MKRVFVNKKTATSHAKESCGGDWKNSTMKIINPMGIGGNDASSTLCKPKAVGKNLATTTINQKT